MALEAANRLCDGDFGSLYMVEGDVLRPTAQRGGSVAQAEYERTHPHTKDRHTLVGRVAVTEQAVHIPDVLADPEYSWPAQQMSGYRAMLGVPILVEGELIGVIGVVRNEPKPFSEDQIELMKTFADQAAIAIANARLIEAVERQRAELSRFLSPRVAELVSSPDGQQLLGGHRAYISCLFCDLRGFTGFVETAEPEELLGVLRSYHRMLGELIPVFDGTLEHFAGDGLMVWGVGGSGRVAVEAAGLWDAGATRGRPRALDSTAIHLSTTQLLARGGRSARTPPRFPYGRSAVRR